MRLHVSHRTVYRYDHPARFLVQSHRLTPVTTGGQTVEAWSVTADGATFGALFTDGAGDAVATMTHPGPIEEIAVVVEGIVATVDTAGVLRGHRETVSPLVYVPPTAPTTASRAVSELRDAALARAGDASDLDRAHRLAAAVAEAVAYETGSSHAHTTAAEALEQGRGVCQDHAHVLIAVARAAGLPARYVTGYLFGNETGEEASHAWAEIHLAGLGWVGFDAANACCPDDRYIRLGSGRDAREAAPIRGIAGGQSGERMEVDVVVAPAGQQSQQQSQSN
jgi:transglutaminase-like putative cysteine protease